MENICQISASTPRSVNLCSPFGLLHSNQVADFSRVRHTRLQWFKRLVTPTLVVVALALAGGSARAQKWEPPAVGPLGKVAVPDVNRLGLLDGQNPGYTKVTNLGRQEALRQLGKAFFWDMQVGGDGVQSCASCHYHAGADHRITNQVSPHGPNAGNDTGKIHDLLGGPNGTLGLTQFRPAGLNRGLLASEGAVRSAGSSPDAADGAPGLQGSKPSATLDINDIVSSQGVRAGTFLGVSGSRVDSHTLATSALGFDLGAGQTARRVPGRNAPSVINAVYNLRNFWDGRAEAFFNGVNPLGFRDPAAAVKASVGGALVDEKLRIPFSSLASQAVGPAGSDVEMAFSGRANRELGRKLLASGVVPLAGQRVSCADSLLSTLTDCSSDGTSNRGLALRTGGYAAWIDEIFDPRFTAAVCVDAQGGSADCSIAGAYTLKEYNFALFFGLAIQAYEASLTTEQTIVDLLVGGIATGTVVNQSGRTLKTVNVAGLSLEQCIAKAAFGNKPAQQLTAENLCTQHYAQFIHPKAVTGSESSVATPGLLSETPIGGCASPKASTTLTTSASACSPNLANARLAMLAINRGLSRLFGGGTGCGICHSNPEFSLATVSALTGFGAAPLPPLPAGQVRKIAPEAVMERMLAANGTPAVYDSGFYNIGVRPTPEDWSQGGQIGGVPLSFNRLGEVLSGGLPNRFAAVPLDLTAINKVRPEIPLLRIPTSPTNLTPRAFPFRVACAPELRAAGCNSAVVPGERLQHFGAFKTPGLRNLKFTGPYMHNGSQMNLRQVVEFYKKGGHFPNLNESNMQEAIGPFDLGVTDEAALVEVMETGLTDWRLAHQEGVFDHPEICVPHGHNADGSTKLVGIPAIGRQGSAARLQTFEEQLSGVNANRANNLQDACGVVGVAPAAP